MKNWKLIILAMSLALSMVFVSCGNNAKKDNGASSNGVVEDVASDVVDGVSGVVSDVVDGVSDVVSDITDNDRDMSDDSDVAKLPASKNLSGVQIDESVLEALDNTTVGWGQGRDVDDENRPTSSLNFTKKYGQYDAVFIGEDKEDIYLTFDEGYENGYTEKILDVLKQKECPAVFFVTLPYVKENPDLISRMIEEGHTIGNHTANHPSMPSVSLEQCAKEITALHDYMFDEFGYEMTVIRPPMGEFSERTLALTQQMGYKSLFWSFAYVDWEEDNQPERGAALERTTTAVHNGAVYLLHAVSKTNTEILGEFIDTLRDEGYTFCEFK